MRRILMIITVLVTLTTVAGLGLFNGWFAFPAVFHKDRKPVVVQTTQNQVDDKTQIIYEQEYQQCQHVIISEFPGAAGLQGKTLEEIQIMYPPESGYTIRWQGTALVLHQQVTGWCPQDQKKCRLKEYRGSLAIYEGPDAANDVLQRVTAIQMDSLPEEIAIAIRAGRYEFDSVELLNDALENLDEYM